MTQADPTCLLTQPPALVGKTPMSREEQLSQFGLGLLRRKQLGDLQGILVLAGYGVFTP